MALEGNNGNEDFIIDENQIDFSFENNGFQEVDFDKDSKDKNDKDSDKDDNTDLSKDKPEEDDEYKDVDKDDLFSFKDDDSDDTDEDSDEDDNDEDENQDDSNEEEDNDDEPKSKASKSKSSKKESGIISTFNMLKDKGIIDYELDDDEELNDDTASDIIEDSFDKAVDNKFSEVLGNLDDERKELIKFISKGGNLDVLASFVGNKNSSINIEKESDQEKLIKKHLTETEFGDSDEIDAQIQFYKDRGTLEKQAKKIFENIEKNQLADRQKALKSQEENIRKNKEQQRKYRQTLVDTLESNSEINDITFNRRDKDLPNYINEPTIQIKDSDRKITPFYRDLYTAMNDPKKMLVLAKIIKNDFDFSSIKNKAISTKTKEVKDNIERSKKDKTSVKSSQKTIKRLADYLDD